MDKLKQVYLDANAVLRYLLQDIDEQYRIVYAAVNEKYCVVSLQMYFSERSKYMIKARNLIWLIA